MKSVPRFWKCLFLCILLLAVGAAPSWTQQPEPLTNESVIELVRAGHSESFILTMISESDTAFSLGPEDQVELENQGVSETIIQAMIKAKADAEAERQLIEQYEAEQPAPAAPAAQTEEEAEAERRLIEQYEAEQPAPAAPAAQTEEEAEAEQQLIEQFEAEQAPATAEESPAPAEPSPPVLDLQVAESYSRGLSVYRNRRYQEALDQFRKVAAAEPDRADVHYLIGYCHLMLRQYEESLAAFRLSFANDPYFDPRTIYQGPPSP